MRTFACGVGLCHLVCVHLTASSASRTRVRFHSRSLSSRAPAAASLLDVTGDRGNVEGAASDVLGRGGIELVRGFGVRKAIPKV